ncbi:unnamed protein product [Rhizoctonia solani]|uniref:NACHT domain-containing protein n=1 Tax=Rhizoctonia solani TaxID=456999 RepID=A0A8H3DUU3_9AGAM|nr:unnamed protein product [Rhizoctonia solani]
MAWKRIFKRTKKKKPESKSRGSLSEADTPSPGNSVRTTSPAPVPSVAVSALVFQPFVPLHTLPPLDHRQIETPVASVDTWTNLTAFSDLLHRTALSTPLVTAIDDLSWFFRAHEDVVATQNEYRAMRSQLEALFADLRTHFSQGPPPEMTSSMLNLCETIQAELRDIYGTQDRNIISRYIQAGQDVDKVLGCYRRIQGHLQRVTLNTSLSIWRTMNEHKLEDRLRTLNPSLAAYYNSAEARIVQRRNCIANTREQVLQDLYDWKNDQGREKVCWINGMAGTGKTTITNTMCSTLEENQELGASFFCTRLIPACRDVKLILPTIAHQLARFSSPFRGALLHVLEQDPEVHSKVLPLQFKRMILDPLQQVAGSLPTTTVVVIDALDECDDGNGVEQILTVLLESAYKLPLKFLVSSRPEHHIRERVRQSALKAQLVLHELDKRMVKADIETYLRAELAAVSASLTEEQFAALVDRAGSLFIYAATVVRYIKGGDTLERLAAVLQVPGLGRQSSSKTKEIDSLYEAVLVSALDNENLEQPEKERMQLVLHTVVCAQEPLTVDALAGLLSLRCTQVTDALKPLWSVLHIAESDSGHRVSTLHASFPDYMRDLNRSNRFGCDAQTHNGKLAELCLRRVGQNQPQSNICDLESSHAFDKDVPNIDDKVKQKVSSDLLYACQYWATHLSLGGLPNEYAETICEFLSKRLLLWMEVLNLTKRINKAVEQIARLVAWLRVADGPESIMRLALDARRFVTMFATSPVSRSTPHLYVSMLSSWPGHQPLSAHYTQQTGKHVKLKGIGQSERQLGLLSLVTADLRANVLCVAHAPTGRFFAAGTTSGSIVIWDAVSCRMTIDPIKGHRTWVRAIAISLDCTRICSGSNDKTLCIWDVQTGQLVEGPLKGHDHWVRSVKYSPDGRWLASGSQDGTVCIWSTDNWQLKSKPFTEPGGRVCAVAFSPDGSTIAVGFESVIHLRDPLNGQMTRDPLEGHTDVICAVVFSPDGKYLISSSADRTILVWDMSSERAAFRPLREHLYSVVAVAVSPDSRLFASASRDDTIRIWDTETWHPRSVLKNNGIPLSVTFSPDGLHLVSGSHDGNIRIWEVPEFFMGHVAHPFNGHSHWVRSITFSPCGSYIVSGSYDRTVCMWDSQTRQLKYSPLKGNNHCILAVGVTSDGNHIFSVSADRMIHVWGRQTGEQESTIGPIETDGQYDATYQEFWPVAFIFDSKRVVCGSKSGRIYLWEDDKLLFSLTGHDDKVTSIAFSPDGQSFASGCEDGVLMMWDTRTRARLFDPLTGHSRRISSIAFSPGGSQVASGSGDTTVRLWDSSSGVAVGSPFRGHTREVRSAAFSRRGDQLVSGSDDMTVRVWDVANHEAIAVFAGHMNMVLSVAFSPDGTQIVSGSADSTIRLWNAPLPGSSSPEDVGSEASPDPAGTPKSHLPLDWEMDSEGWVRDTQGRLLLWVPPDLRSILMRRQNSGLISSQGCIELDFSDAKIGDEWDECYVPL